MGMYPNMFGMDPNNMNLNVNPGQMGNMQFNGDMGGMGMGMPFYPSMYQGMGNPQQNNNNNDDDQQNN